MPEEIKENRFKNVNNSRRFCNSDLYDEVSEELELDKDLVLEVIESNATFNKHVIERGMFESVILPYLGKLKARLSFVQKATNKINRPA